MKGGAGVRQQGEISMALKKGKLKIFVDGAYKKENAGVGLVIRDYVGDEIAPMACNL